MKAKATFLGTPWNLDTNRPIQRRANQHYAESFLALKWRQTVAWTKWLAIRFAIGMGALALLLAGYSVWAFDNGRTLTVQNVIAPPVIDIKKARMDMVHQLAVLENKGGVPCYLDDNSSHSLSQKDKVSCGDMAYKISTVQRHAKECNNLTLTNEQAVNLALDPEKAYALADCAIFDHGHLGEWTAATPEMFIKVKVINGLTK